MASNQKLKLHIDKIHQSKNDLIDISLNDLEEVNETSKEFKQESKVNENLINIQEKVNYDGVDLTPDDFEILQENFL